MQRFCRSSRLEMTTRSIPPGTYSTPYVGSDAGFFMADLCHAAASTGEERLAHASTVIQRAEVFMNTQMCNWSAIAHRPSRLTANSFPTLRGLDAVRQRWRMTKIEPNPRQFLGISDTTFGEKVPPLCFQRLRGEL